MNCRVFYNYLAYSKINISPFFNTLHNETIFYYSWPSNANLLLNEPSYLQQPSNRNFGKVFKTATSNKQPLARLTACYLPMAVSKKSKTPGRTNGTIPG